MGAKSILTEAKQISRAVALIQLGARLQVLESETDLSYERLLRLYKEVAGKSPSKGQLPFSTDWFMTWQPNIHASLFLNIHEYLNKSSELDEIDAVIKAYQLYQEQTTAQGLEPLLSVTRAWRLVKFVDNGMLTMTKCSKCGRPVRLAPARDRQALRVRPVQPAGARRQGQGERLDPHALTVRRIPFKLHQGPPKYRVLWFSCLSPPAHQCFEYGSFGARFFLVRRGKRRCWRDRPDAPTATLK